MRAGCRLRRQSRQPVDFLKLAGALACVFPGGEKSRRPRRRGVALEFEGRGYASSSAVTKTRRR